MKKSKRLLALIVAFCCAISCFSPIHSYAQTNTVTSDKTAATGQTANPQNTKDTKNENNTKESKDTKDTVVTQDAEDKKAAENGEDINKADDKSGIKGAENPADPGPGVETAAPPDAEAKDKNEDEEDLWFRKQNPMKKEHQQLLWDYCKKRKVNYIDMLALIYTESNFDEKCSTGKYYGYFQISRGNCANLAAELKTKNKPLDGAVNINWGTAMYSWILADKRVKDAADDKKRDVALSIYQRGTGGYDKYGISTSFLKIYYKKRNKVVEWYEEKK